MAKITADTITDEQIRSILELPEFIAAKAADRPPWRSVAYDVNHSLTCEHEPALCRPRARCAEILNARTWRCPSEVPGCTEDRCRHVAPPA